MINMFMKKIFEQNFKYTFPPNFNKFLPLNNYLKHEFEIKKKN